MVVALMVVAVAQAGDSIFRSGFEAGEDVTTLSSYKVAETELPFEAGFLALEMGCNAEAPLTGTLELSRPGQGLDESGYDFVINEEGMLDNVLALHPQCDGTEPGAATYLVDAVNKSDPVDVATAAINVAVGPEYVLATGPVAATYTCGDQITISTNAENLRVVGGPGTVDGSNYTFTPDCTNDLGDRTVGLRGEKSTLVHPDHSIVSSQTDDLLVNYKVVPQDITVGLDLDENGSIDKIITNNSVIEDTICNAVLADTYQILIDGKTITGTSYTPIQSVEPTTTTFNIDQDGRVSVNSPSDCSDFGNTLYTDVTIQYTDSEGTGETTFSLEIPIDADKNAWATEYVNRWLPADNLSFYLSNTEIRAMINGTASTPSYAREMAQIIVDHDSENTFDIDLWEQVLYELADGDTSNDELWQAEDPYLWDNDALGEPGVVLYDNFSDGTTSTIIRMDQAGMSEMYELVKGVGNPAGFLKEYVKANPGMYGGEPAGIPNIDFNPTWNTSDPNNFSP